MPVYALSASSFAAYILDFRVNTNAWSLGIALWIFGYQQFMTIITMMLTGDLVYKHHIRIKKKKDCPYVEIDTYLWFQWVLNDYLF